jgi:hypothetical protein
VAIEKERDWDKEMAEVDRLLKKLPNADPTLGRSRGEPTVKKPAVGGGSGSHLGIDARTRGREVLGTWARVLLGLLVGVGVAPGVWPYTHGCGLYLMLYLGGVTTVIAAGLWSSVSSWRHRLGFAHVIAQLLIVWGTLLLAREVIPRVGAKPQATWLCP